MNADGDIAILGGRPERIVIRMAKALPVDGRGADHDRMRAEFGHALDLLHGQRGLAERDMGRGKEAVTMAGADLERPGIVGPTEGRGELRVLDFAFP